MGILDMLWASRRPVIYYMTPSPDASVQVLNYSAQRLYQTQDNLQAVVNFLGESVGQLPLKVYRREGDTERIRDRDSTAAKLLWQPNVVQTAFEFFRALYIEYGIFGCVYVWVIQSTESESGYEMYIVPSTWVIGTEGRTVYAADTIRVCTGQGGDAVDIPKSEFIQFKTYSPGNPGGYLSPLTALRQTMQEQIEAGNFRKQLWHSSGRLNAQIIRPKDVRPWDEGQRKNFINAFREQWGAGGSKAGGIPLLEDGMEIKPFQTSFKEQQWAESVQLSREAVAAIYRVNPALIWHTSTQTYASAKDNARALYSECLGPTLQMIQQRVNAFLLPMVGAERGTYVEFDLQEKLKGSFEERASILQTAVGGPWMTRDEARAYNNLPPLPDDQGKELIVPLNVVEGGQASPTDTHTDPKAMPRMRSKSEVVRIKSKSTQDEDERMIEVLKQFFERQKKSVLPKLNAGAENWWNESRWDRELAEDMLPIVQEIADRHGMKAAEVLETPYSTEITQAYLQALAEGRAHAINKGTRQKLEEAEQEAEDLPEDEKPANTPEKVFDKRINASAVVFGISLATQIAGWATVEAAHQAQRSEGFHKILQKEWVTGANARSTHAAMNGQRVGIDSVFSNGARWPGDDNLSPDESCGCNCSTDVIISF